ncbi:MAG: helix-turn-helix domain-containing protein, partial [Salinibacter sp.]
AAEEDVVAGLEAGADAYVEKPFSMETLRARIQNLLESRAALRDRYSDEVVVEPSGVSVTPEEKEFYQEARTVVEAHIDESGFTVEQFAGELSMSRSTLRRRLKDVTGQTPAAFVRHLRLERAAQLLREDADLRVYEVADAVGYESPDHFARLFREHVGVFPSEYPGEE